jgi:SIR2-like domain
MTDGTSRELVGDFRRNRLIFFAGSGISLRSGLPSASRVEEATWRGLLSPERKPHAPGNHHQAVVESRQAAELFERIQPEVLYEVLLRGYGSSPEVLRSWQVLWPGLWRSRGGGEPLPTISHYVAVSYSWMAQVPILTTNFDSLFEQAAANLTQSGIDVYAGLFGATRVVTAPAEIAHMIDNPSGRKQLLIAKLHGSISGSGKGGTLDRPDVESLRTTITSITQRDFRLLRSLHNAMRERSLVVIGYSGRDIDLFPHIRDFSRQSGTRPVYWIDNFARRPVDVTLLMSRRNARSLRNARIIGTAFPDEIFDASIRTLLPLASARRLVRRLAPSPAVSSDLREKGELLLEDLSAEAKSRLNPSNRQRLTLMGLLYLSAGMYTDAYALLESLRAASTSSNISSGPPDPGLISHALIQAAHNTSNYGRIDPIARELTKIRTSPWSPLYQIVGRGYLLESRRMAVPYDTVVFRDVGARVYRDELMNVFESSYRLRRWIRRTLTEHGLGTGLTIDLAHIRARCPEAYALAIAVQQHIVESEIRLGSLGQVLLKCEWEVRGNPRSTELVTRLAAHWRVLEGWSYRLGYVNGLAFCYKFLSRLPTGQNRSRAMAEGVWLSSMLEESTTQELLLRNQIEDLLNRMPVSELESVPRSRVSSIESKILKMRAQSRQSGNRLNQVKAILAIGEFNRIVKAQSSFNKLFYLRGEDYLPELRTLTRQIGLTAWTGFLNTLEQSYPAEPRYSLAGDPERVLRLMSELDEEVRSESNRPLGSEGSVLGRT